jgi:hypothetical protein
MQNKFGFDPPSRTDLLKKIAEAVKEWRISSLEYDRLLAEWHTEPDENRKEILWKEYNLIQKISEGDLAQLQLLADRYINETENPGL